MPQLTDHAPYKILSRLPKEKMFNTCLIIFILFKSIFQLQYYFQRYGKILQNEDNNQIYWKSIHPEVNKLSILLLFKADNITTYDDNSKPFSEHVLRLLLK